ncbi:hypothetical protein M8494_07550 [Serratia ureilytica]
MCASAAQEHRRCAGTASCACSAKPEIAGQRRAWRALATADTTGWRWAAKQAAAAVAVNG